jgi:hypothetical protein
MTTRKYLAAFSWLEVKRSSATHLDNEPRQSLWGQARIAAERFLKLGIQGSPRTVQKYLLGDLQNALSCFRWFEAEFPNDCGEPGHHLCWALALYRDGDHEAAARRLRQAMLMNLYLVPHLLGQETARIEIWHSSSDAEPGYLAEIPLEFFSLWDEKERQWAGKLYHSEPIRAVLSRYVEIYRELQSMPPGPERTRLVIEASSS